MTATILDWPDRLSLASLPTPLHPLKRWSRLLGGPDIWIKRDDLTGALLSGNKVRKLEFTLAHALNHGHDLLITCGGLQSNHCRATAFAGAQLGLPVHLVLRGETTSIDGNLLLDYLAGAKVSMQPTIDYQRRLPEILEEVAQDYRSQGYKPYIIPTGASDDVGVWGYFAACEELKQDFVKHSINPDLIVTATGSGGTQAGLTLGSDYYDLGCPVLGMAVCDDEQYFYEKVTDDITQFQHQFGHCFRGLEWPEPITSQLTINTNDSYIGDGYAKASEDVLKTISDLAAMEGILLDPVYSGKAFYGLTEEIRHGKLSHLKQIVFIHTGGSWGLFPWRDAFSELIKR